VSIPKDIHKPFFQNSATEFREVTANAVDDKSLKLKRELGKASMAEVFFPILEERFRMVVNSNVG